MSVENGRQLAMDTLAGRPTPRSPVALFTWGFDYTWRVAGVAPWQLACGGHATWQAAYRALHVRHQPDLMFYDGIGDTDTEPELLEETPDHWLLRDGNGVEYAMDRRSLALRHRASGRKTCDAIGAIATRADVDRLIAPFTGWGETYLSGLRGLIEELGARTLVLPHHSPAYICACYAFGFETAMAVMLDDPALFRYTCDRIAADDNRRMRELADAGAEAVFIADGWASADIISPALFEQFALPYQRAITAAAHDAGLRIILWNEGNILPFLTHEASLPVDAFAFEQPRKGVALTVAAVRATFGPRRCLFGNLDSELLLLRNDPTEIAAAVADQARQSGPGTPFIHCTGSPLPSDVAPEAVDVLMRAAYSGVEAMT